MNDTQLRARVRTVLFVLDAVLVVAVIYVMTVCATWFLTSFIID